MDPSHAEGSISLTIALPSWLGPVVMLLVCAAAFLKGGVEERLTAGSMLINVGVTVLLRDHSWLGLQNAGFAADLGSLLLFLGIALTSSKFWPMAMAGFQLLIVLTHISKIIDRTFEQWAYITAIVIWTHLQIITLGIGVWNHWRAQAYAPSVARVETRR
jgi:hypothetical protein